MLLIATAGGLGALARWGLAGVVQNLAGGTFPWGTAVVNLLGSFAFGLAVAVMEGRFSISPQTRFFLLTGFLGAFTTFSTLIFETQQLLEDSQWLLAAGNLVLQNAAGLVVILLGLMLGRMI